MIPASPCHAQPADWRRQYRDIISSPGELLAELDLTHLAARIPANAAGFPLRVPRAFVARMRRGDENDRVAGLDVGADDYITKPFSTKELLARIRAVLRRRAPEPESTVLELGKLSLDTGTYRVHYDDQPIKLGPTEFKLLHYLMKNAERVHSRAQLLDRVWGDHVFIEERTVDVHVKRLRESMGAASSMVETVRGAGYRITALTDSPVR